MKLRVLLEAISQDAQFARRALRRDRTFTAGVILTLALGIGATGAVFSILQAALLQPLPYDKPSELVVLGRRSTDSTPTEYDRLPGARLLSSPMVLGWRRELASQLGDVAAFRRPDPLDVAQGDRTERLNVAAVTPNFFEVLGVRAAWGRAFSSADETSGEPLILLSEALASRLYGRNRAIIGHTLKLTGGTPGTERSPQTYFIAGILPRGVHFTYPDEIQAWVLMPWSAVERYNPQVLGFSAVARLKLGVSLALARQRSIENDIASGHAPHVTGLEPMHDWVVGETRSSLQLLGGVAALLLLTTCVTVANGLLARFSERRQELVVRSALGARRSRLVMQLLTEGAMLSIAGAVAGTLLVIIMLPVLRTLLPASVPRVGELALNGAILAFGATIAALTTVLAAVAPAYAGTRGNGAAMRATGTASANRHATRWRQGLLATQAALGTALLLSAALLLTSFWNLRRVPLGFDGDQVATAELRLLDIRYSMRWSRQRFQDDLLARLRAVPGLTAAITSTVPFGTSEGTTNSSLLLGNKQIDMPANLKIPGFSKSILVKYRIVDPEYFRLLRVSAVRGRLLTDGDREGTARVTVISESLARQAFGDTDPIGKTVGSAPPLEVVGVVRDLYYANLERDPAPAFYVSRAQDPPGGFSLMVRSRTGADPSSITSAVRQAIRELDPSLPVPNFTTIGTLVDASVANRRFYTVATVAFALLALLLTIAGLVVVVVRVVHERRRELAIRAALGASSMRIVQVATRDALLAAGVGVVLGLLGAYAGSGVLARFLFGVGPRSSVTYVAVAMLVLIVATLGAWGPVRRFDRVSIGAMLKAE